jgi:hypothetical protein
MRLSLFSYVCLQRLFPVRFFVFICHVYFLRLFFAFVFRVYFPMFVSYVYFSDVLSV